MFDMQQMVDAVGKVMRGSRSQYHLTLQDLIDTLAGVPADMPVTIDRGGAPGALDSYRGFYDDLAFAPSEAPTMAGALRAACVAALGHTFTGYKGGDFVMGPDTPLWLSAYGSASGVAIVGAVLTGAQVILTTRDVQ